MPGAVMQSIHSATTEPRLPEHAVRPQLLRRRHPGHRRRVLRRRLAHLAGRRPGRRRQRDLCARRHHSHLRQLHRAQRREPGGRRVDRRDHHLRQLRGAELRQQPRQHLSARRAPPPARRQVGGDLRQRLRQRHRGRRHLRHDDRPDHGCQRPSTTSSTKTGSTTNNGIAFASPADLDGDHIIDYVYAGDLQGNVWRFDLTSTSETSWAVSTVSGNPAPVFKTASGQPITTAIVRRRGRAEPRHAVSR